MAFLQVGSNLHDRDKIDFVPVIDELNQLSEMYTRSISIRDANNKRKTNKEKEGEEGGEEGREDAGEPMTTAMCFGNGGRVDGGAYEGIAAPFKGIDNPVD